MAKVLCTIVETSIFTRLVQREMDAEDYRALQLELAQTPRSRRTDSGVRWSSEDALECRRAWKARRCSPHLFLGTEATASRHAYLYPKNERTDLTKEQLKVLARVVKGEFK